MNTVAVTAIAAVEATAVIISLAAETKKQKH
jgi:hypothetical protein